jgi:hypothetical protein
MRRHNLYSPTDIVVVAARLLASQGEDLLRASFQKEQAAVVHADAGLVQVVDQQDVLAIENAGMTLFLQMPSSHAARSCPRSMLLYQSSPLEGATPAIRESVGRPSG